jgi:hypothetical protein
MRRGDVAAGPACGSGRDGLAGLERAAIADAKRAPAPYDTAA